MTFKARGVALSWLLPSLRCCRRRHLRRRDDKKRSKQEKDEIEVARQGRRRRDGRAAGADRRADEDRTRVPEVAGSAHRSCPSRSRSAGFPPARTPPSTSAWSIRPQPVDPKKKVEYPWDDVHFVPAAQLAGTPARLNRVFMAKPGTYDVYA